MPRKIHYPQRRLEVRVPEELALKVELFLPRDSRSGAVEYGAWSSLVTRLFNDFLNERAKAPGV